MAKAAVEIDEEREITLRFLEAVRIIIFLKKFDIKNRKQFAESIDMEVAYFYRIESGTNWSVPNKYIGRMVKKYGISGDWVLTGEGDPYPGIGVALVVDNKIVHKK